MDLRWKLRVVFWVAAFLMALPLVGHYVALPLFVIVFMVAEGERWWQAVIIAAVIWAFVYFVLSRLIHVNLPLS